MSTTVPPEARRIVQLIIQVLALISLQPHTVTTSEDDLEVLICYYDPWYHRFIQVRVSRNGRIIGDHRISALIRPSACRATLGGVAAATFNYAELQRLFDIMGSAVHRDLRTMYKWMTTRELARALLEHMNQPNYIANAQSCNQPCLHGLSPRDIEEKGIARVHYGQVHFSAVAFRVLKSDGLTSRFVWNGHEYDKLHQEVMGKPPKMPTLHPRDVIARTLAGWKHISTVDFTSWFFQFELPPELRPFFAFTTSDHTTMCMRVLPMGVCWAPTWAQHVALFITQVARHSLGNITFNFDVVVWIDNIVVLSNSASDDARVRSAIDAVCRQLGVVAKDWDIGTHDGTYIARALGFEIDLRQQWLRPAKKSRDKLLEAINEFRTTRTPAQYFTLVGNLMWFAFVGAHPLCFFGDFMRFLREQSQHAITAKERHSWTTADPITFNDSIFDMVHEVYLAVRDTIVRGPQHRPPPSELKWSTDASPHAAAGVTSYNDAVFVLPLATSPRGILPAELLAGFLAALLQGDERNRRQRAVTWVTDNQAAYYAVLKAHSANELADIILCAWLLFAKLPDHVTWVPSKCQPADHYTRPWFCPTSTADHQEQLQLHRIQCPKCMTDSHSTAEVPRYDDLQTDGVQ